MEGALTSLRRATAWAVAAIFGCALVVPSLVAVSPGAGHAVAAVVLLTLTATVAHRYRKVGIDQGVASVSGEVVAVVVTMILLLAAVVLIAAVGVRVPQVRQIPKLGLAAGTSFMVLQAVAEEVLFRGGLIGAWRDKLGPVLALCASTALFALAHVVAAGSLQAGSLPLLCGVILGGAYLRRRSLATPLIAHVLWNAIWQVIQHG
jgi:membrane protease YdiL (CAAX protease family)